MVSGSNSTTGENFPHLSRQALGPKQPLVQWYWVSFPGVKQSKNGTDHPPPPKAEVKERVELYLYSSAVPSWPMPG